MGVIPDWALIRNNGIHVKLVHNYITCYLGNITVEEI